MIYLLFIGFLNVIAANPIPPKTGNFFYANVLTGSVRE